MGVAFFSVQQCQPHFINKIIFLTIIYLITMGIQWIFIHSSLLRTFGLNATSTYDSYLSLIFGKFALIWGYFQNVSMCRFWGHWGRRGQTTSKTKTMKILNENLLKLDEIQILASVTSKMASMTSRISKGAQWIFPKNTFFKSGQSTEKNKL